MVMTINSTQPCAKCGVEFQSFPSAKRKFCGRDCYWSYLTIGERHSKLSAKERQFRYRSRIWDSIKNECSCGLKKMEWSENCISCYFASKKGKRPHNYKGGKANHLHHSRERYFKMKIAGSHTDAEWESLKVKCNFMCLCCKNQEPYIKLTRDHIIPISVGGLDTIENIQPLCGPCNSRKYTKIIDYSLNVTAI